MKEEIKMKEDSKLIKIGKENYSFPSKSLKWDKSDATLQYQQHKDIDNSDPTYPRDTYRPILSHKMRLLGERIYTPFFTMEFLWRYKDLFWECINNDKKFNDYVTNTFYGTSRFSDAAKDEFCLPMFNFYKEEPAKLFKLIKKMRKKNLKDNFNGNLEKLVKEQLPKDEKKKKEDLDSRTTRKKLWESKKVEGKISGTFSKESSTEASEPSLLKMTGNFAKAMKDFAVSGFETVTAEQHAKRMKICEGCEFWKPGARFGLGKCLKCGCTGSKQWIATSVCPIEKWGAISKEEVKLSKEQENVSLQ